MTEINHGTTTAYTYNKCRCQECTEAWRAYGNEARARRVEEGLADGDDRHGTKNGYVNYGCRCVECKLAYTNGPFGLREAGFGHEVYIRELGGWFQVGARVD